MARDTAQSSSLILILILLGLLAFVCGMFLVWLQISRSDLEWKIGENQRLLTEKATLTDKLEIERDRLLAPDGLRYRAAASGMARAGSDQVRRLPDPSPEASK